MSLTLAQSTKIRRQTLVLLNSNMKAAHCGQMKSINCLWLWDWLEHSKYIPVLRNMSKTRQLVKYAKCCTNLPNYFKLNYIKDTGQRWKLKLMGDYTPGFAILQIFNNSRTTTS